LPKCIPESVSEKSFLSLVFGFRGRQQDVRATEIDKVDMYQSYRPGDIVRAMVVSFRQKYLLILHSSTDCSCFFRLIFALNILAVWST
jgi:hypothetical protein